MNIRAEIKELKTGERELRKFGWLVGGVFAVLGLLMWMRHKPLYPYFITPGLVLVIAGLLVPKALKWIYVAWMSLAIVLGHVMSIVILTVFYFLVITPMGLVARLVGRDFLSLKLDRQASSYWIRRDPVPKTAAEYEQQF
jgi:hypothetical protein